MIASYVLRSEGQHNLDVLAMEHLNYRMVSFDELTGTGKERKDIREIPASEVGNYSAEDADITMQLVNILHDKLASQGMSELCSKVEFPLVSVLAKMEYNGINIDTDLLSKMSKDLERQLDNLIAKIYDDAGERFNINSTQQLSVILFERLKLTPLRKTKTGFSTDVAVLEALRKEHPIVERMLEYRQLSKLKSTYVDALPKLIHPSTGKVHTSFNQAVAATGRLSSSDPNLQNIPIRTEIGAGNPPGIYSQREEHDDDVGGLFSDRASHYGAYFFRPRIAGSIHGGGRHPRKHGGESIRGRPQRSHQRNAAESKRS